MSRYLNRRTLLAGFILVLLAIFLPPLISVNRFRPRVAGALSRALGRPVTIDSVSLRLLPAPGLNMRRLVVQDDPDYSAEPILRAEEVTASLRLASLWRGRLEIARLSLSYPSLNLVRRPDGHWNLESVLERARQTPTAPTTKLRAEARPRFPYVEADGGRINLKIGQEKTVYSLMDAAFALWLPSENEWRLRLAARPVRTDANLSDTGTVKVNGRIVRGSSLSDTPVAIKIELDRAQLGQLTTLAYGRDRGWRGTVDIAATLDGTPADLKISGDASVNDFRRYDIATSGAVRLLAHCTGNLSSVQQQVRDIECRAPVGGGAVDVRGQVTGLLPVREFVFEGVAQQVPAASLSAMALRMKKDLPEDLSAEGLVNATLAVRRSSGSQVTWTGSGSSSELQLRSGKLTKPLTLGPLEFTVGAPSSVSTVRQQPQAHAQPPENALVVAPFPLQLGGAKPAEAQARFSSAEYNLSVAGDAGITRLLELAEALGIAAPPITATGATKLDVKVAGTWAGFAPPLVTGTAQVRATATVPGIAAPVQITSATLALDSQRILARDLAISFGGKPIAVTGLVALPRRCIGTGTCSVEFQLASPAISADALNGLLNPRMAKRPWYQWIASGGAKSLLGRIRAHGQFAVDRFNLGALVANRVSGDVILDKGTLTVRNLRGEALGGKSSGELNADFTRAEPVYTLTGRLDQASVAAVASLTKDTWGTGRISATYSVKFSGNTAAEMRASTEGKADFDWREGTIVRLALDGQAGPLQIRDFSGQVTLTNGQLSFATSKLQTLSGIYEVRGTASLDRRLGLLLSRGKASAYEITGTLDKPRIASPAVPRTQVALKP